ncbi:MAG: hypothetical protein M3239_07290 [Thermoproteota archaeon]|nr:hypothetical protein [Thermoproteota archaeon]
MPLLVEKGLVDIAEIRKIAEYCNNNNDGRGALVAQPGRELPLIESENKKGALAGIRARDLYLSGGGSPPKKGLLPYQGNALPGYPPSSFRCRRDTAAAAAPRRSAFSLCDTLDNAAFYY